MCEQKDAKIEHSFLIDITTGASEKLSVELNSSNYPAIGKTLVDGMYRRRAGNPDFLQDISEETVSLNQ